MNKPNPLHLRPTTNKHDGQFQMMRGMEKSVDRVQTNINNLTSDFDLCSPLSNNNLNHIGGVK